MRLALCLVLISLFLGIRGVSALDPDKPFHNYVLDAWSIEQGLPQISVSAITQDQDGYIWAGTQAGLARFDGVRFKVFSQDNTPQLPGNFIQHLHVDRSGQLWIATYKGLVRYANSQFTPFAYTAPNATNESTLNIQKIAEDRKGNIWVATLEGFYRTQGQQLIAVPQIQGSTYSVNTIHNSVWVGQVGKAIEILNDQFIEHALPREYALAIVMKTVKRHGVTWFGTNKGLLVQSSGSNSIEEFSTDSQLFRFPIDALEFDSDNNLWVGTFNGLFRIRDGEVVEQVKNNNPHHFQHVLSIFEDGENNLWLGSHRDGIARVWNGRIFRYSVPEGLNEPLVWSIHAARNDRGVWTGTNQGLSLLSNGKFTNLVKGEQLPHPTAYSLYEDDHNTLWIGTRKGLALYRNGQVEKSPHDHKLAAVQISSIVPYGNSAMLLGTSSGVFVHTQQSLIPIKTRDENALFVRPIVKLNNDQILVGSQTGLFEFNGDQLLPVGLDNGLSGSLDVTGILDLGYGRIAISTISNGIFIFENNYWHQFSEKDGLPVNESFTLLADELGNLWVSGFKGLYRVPIEHLIQYRDGLRSNISAYMFLSESGGLVGSQKAFCCNGAGNSKGFIDKEILWYPTRDGVIELNTQNITLNKVMPNVRIEQIKFTDQWVDLRPGQTLNLAEDERDLSFNYTALSFRDPKSVLFQYRLLGYQDEWKKPEYKSQRQVNYTNLPPGNYSFQVKAANNAGLWNPDVAEFSFTIRAHFYESVWFYIVVFAVTGVVVFVWHQHRLRSLRQKKIELEEQIAAHTAQLKVSNQKLKQAVNALEEINQTDQLTGLKNRRYLNSQLPADLAHFERQLTTVFHSDTMIFAIVDIDHFKQINDNYGHKAGDTILHSFADVIETHIRECDYAVRWGGEEFIIVFRPMPRTMATIIIERIRKAIEDYDFMTDDGVHINITASIGFVEYPFFNDEIKLLNWEHTVELADQALYYVKNHGRNGWACFQATETTEHEANLLFRIKQDLEKELMEGRLHLLSSWDDTKN